MRYLISFLLFFHFATFAELQSITAKDGVLYYADGKEVNLWGVNFQPSLSFEHAARMENQNLLMPLQLEDLKKVTDESFDEVQLIGSELIGIHLDPADYSDVKGISLKRFGWIFLITQWLNPKSEECTFTSHFSTILPMREVSTWDRRTLLSKLRARIGCLRRI